MIYVNAAAERLFGWRAADVIGKDGRALMASPASSEEADRVWYTEFPEPRAGQWSPYSDRPGLGLELNPEAVQKYAV